MLGHEVVAETADGRRVSLVHHRPCGACDRCLAGHESTCERVRRADDRARRLRRACAAHGDASTCRPRSTTPAATYVEPLACVLRGAERVPRGRVLVVGHGFVGRLFAEVLRRRGDDVFASTSGPSGPGVTPDGPVDAAVLCAPGGAARARSRRAVRCSSSLPRADRPRRRLPPRADARRARARRRRGTWRRQRRSCRSWTSRSRRCCRCERFDEGLALYAEGRALKVVFRP